MTEKFEFQVGDVCSYMGLEGEIVNEFPIYYSCPLQFKSRTGLSFAFTKDGRRHPEHTIPSLTLIERPKRKVKRWVNLYRNKRNKGFYSGHEYKSREEADNDALPERIACVELEMEDL